MAARKYQKPPNGQAQSGSYLLVFDLDDEAQAKAWSVAQQLTSQRKLKHVLVGMLLAIGKALKPAHPRGGQLDKSEVVFHDRYPAGAS